MHLTLLLADHCSAASATMALEVFHTANLFSGGKTPLFEIQTASMDGQSVNTLTGQQLKVDTPMAAIRCTDLVVIPGFLFTLKKAALSFPGYGKWLRQQHRQGATIASMCTASFLLAESGLLDHVRSTTHWAFADLLQRSYPNIDIDKDQIVCDAGQLITSGGASAAMDLLLHLVRRFGSLEIAQTCSKYLLIDNVRAGQSAYIMWSTPKNHSDPAVLKVQSWLEKNYASRMLIDDLAHQFGFGIRNFKRRFKEATGYSPLAYLQALRLEKAKHLLESTRIPIDSITLKVGYEDSNSFRKLFLRQIGLLPTAYRKQFQSKH